MLLVSSPYLLNTILNVNIDSSDSLGVSNTAILSTETGFENSRQKMAIKMETCIYSVHIHTSVYFRAFTFMHYIKNYSDKPNMRVIQK
jgi:hypothetical protein